MRAIHGSFVGATIATVSTQVVSTSTATTVVPTATIRFALDLVNKVFELSNEKK